MKKSTTASATSAPQTTPQASTSFERMIEAKKKLSEVSKALRPLMEEKGYSNINEAIKAEIYAPQGHVILKSFEDWKKDGYSIRKGSQGLALWSGPVQVTTASGENKTVFRIKFLFSNLQVFIPKHNG